jgi:endogenous inhibitor of DNA gyrase (YacG/DUF329 family)
MLQAGGMPWHWWALRGPQMKAQQPVTLEVECPSCQKPFTITDAQAGSKHSCPHCQQHVELEPAEETQTKEQPVSPPVKTTDVSLKVLLGVVSVVLVIGLLAVVVGMLYAKNRVLTGRLHRLDGRMDGNNALVQLDVGPKPGFYIADNGDDLQVIIITEYGTLKRAGFQWKYETRAGNVLVSSPFGVTAYKMETDSLVDGKDVYKLDENGSKRKQIPAPGKYVALVIYNKNNKVDENYGFGSRSVTMD